MIPQDVYDNLWRLWLLISIVVGFTAVMYFTTYRPMMKNFKRMADQRSSNSAAN